MLACCVCPPTPSYYSPIRQRASSLSLLSPVSFFGRPRCSWLLSLSPPPLVGCSFTPHQFSSRARLPPSFPPSLPRPVGRQQQFARTLPPIVLPPSLLSLSLSPLISAWRRLSPSEWSPHSTPQSQLLSLSLPPPSPSLSLSLSPSRRRPTDEGSPAFQTHSDPPHAEKVSVCL